jgi:PAS domain S-box-containing protein
MIPKMIEAVVNKFMEKKTTISPRYRDMGEEEVRERGEKYIGTAIHGFIDGDMSKFNTYLKGVVTKSKAEGVNLQELIKVTRTWRHVVIETVSEYITDQDQLGIFIEKIHDFFDEAVMIVAAEFYQTVMEMVRDRSKDVEDMLVMFEQLLESSTDPVYSIDTEGRFMFINKAMEKILDYTKDELIGEDFRKILTRESIKTALDKFLRRMAGENVPPYEVDFKTKSGEKIPVEIVASPIVREGRIVGAWGVVRDMTQHKRLQAELKAYSEKLKGEIDKKTYEAKQFEDHVAVIVRLSNDAIISFDPDGKIIAWNKGAENIFGYSEDEAMNSQIEKIVPPEGLEEFKEILREVNARGFIKNHESKGVTKSGQNIEISSTVNLVKDKHGEIAAFFLVTRDITEQKMMERDLVRSKLELEQAVEELKRHNIELEKDYQTLRKAMEIKPALEAQSETEELYTLPPGVTYLIFESKADLVFEVFADLVTHGVGGLCISRSFPDKIRDEYGLKKTPIVWLTTNRLEQFHCISPSGIAELSSVIVAFLERTKNGVIMLEGLEYLISQNSYKTILNLFQLLNDKIMMSDSRLLISMDPLTLDEKETHLLQKETNIFLPEKDEEIRKRYKHLLERRRYETGRE